MGGGASSPKKAAAQPSVATPADPKSSALTPGTEQDAKDACCAGPSGDNDPLISQPDEQLPDVSEEHSVRDTDDSSPQKSQELRRQTSTANSPPRRLDSRGLSSKSLGATRQQASDGQDSSPTSERAPSKKGLLGRQGSQQGHQGSLGRTAMDMVGGATMAVVGAVRDVGEQGGKIVAHALEDTATALAKIAHPDQVHGYLLSKGNFYREYKMTTTVLGSGAFAVVKVCEKKADGEKCAVKIIAKEGNDEAVYLNDEVSGPRVERGTKCGQNRSVSDLHTLTRLVISHALDSDFAQVRGAREHRRYV